MYYNIYESRFNRPESVSLANKNKLSSSNQLMAEILDFQPFLGCRIVLPITFGSSAVGTSLAEDCHRDETKINHVFCKVKPFTFVISILFGEQLFTYRMVCLECWSAFFILLYWTCYTS